jgi:hypothetical protein
MVSAGGGERVLPDSDNESGRPRRGRTREGMVKTFNSIVAATSLRAHQRLTNARRGIGRPRRGERRSVSLGFQAAFFEVQRLGPGDCLNLERRNGTGALGLRQQMRKARRLGQPGRLRLGGTGGFADVGGALRCLTAPCRIQVSARCCCCSRWVQHWGASGCDCALHFDAIAAGVGSKWVVNSTTSV